RRFGLAIREYGGSIWCDPYRWIPEAARLLRPGADLIFLVNGTFLMLCAPELDSEGPATDRLRRDYFGMHRFEWADDPSVDFHLGYGDWIRLFRASAFEVVDLIEIQAPEGAVEHRHEALPYADWARKWPSEEIWRVRKRA